MARKRAGAGALSERVAFLEPDNIDDGYGGITTGYVERFSDAARLQPLFGSRLTVESVVASRLASEQPYNLIVRSSSATRAVGPDWRVRNVRNGRTYNIKTIVNPDERNAYLEMLIVEGQAG